jgi:sigma-E factor negative regulatory protein RseC
MLDQGKVIRVEKDLAWVEFPSSSACAGCGACHRAPSGAMVNEAENPIGAKVGDSVEVEISPIVTTLFPAIAFGIPVLLLFIGLGIGSILSETAAITAGLLFLVLGFIITRLLDKYISAHNKYVSRVIRRI